MFVCVKDALCSDVSDIKENGRRWTLAYEIASCVIGRRLFAVEVSRLADLDAVVCCSRELNNLQRTILAVIQYLDLLPRRDGSVFFWFTTGSLVVI